MGGWPDASIEAVFHELGTAETIRRRERAAFERLTRGATRAVVFGCGALGRLVVPAARRAGISLVGYADNNASLWGQTLDDLPVMSPSAAVAEHGEDVYFVVAVYNGSGPRRQLQELGSTRVVPYAAFCWRYGAHFSAVPPIELPHRIVANPDEIMNAFGCLADQKSRVEFAGQISWRCTLDFEVLPPPDRSDEIYFPGDLMRLGPSEVFVDCGAFDGDSIQMFLTKSRGTFDRIFGCEPDPANRQALAERIAGFPSEVSRRISVFPVAVGSTDGFVSFDSSADAGSHVTSSQSADMVESRRLDSILKEVSPTIIKMDIEGAEPEAIAGAQETIRRARPILAVCAYHKCEHLWTLPRLMKAILPDYQISLRRYAEECWELVYYAIPPERVPVVAD